MSSVAIETLKKTDGCRRRRAGAVSRDLDLVLFILWFLLLLFANEARKRPLQQRRAAARCLLPLSGSSRWCFCSVCCLPLAFVPPLSLSRACSRSLTSAALLSTPTLKKLSFQKKKLFHNSEAFAAWLPPFGVPLSYAVAIGYVVVDTIDKGLKAYSAAGAELERGAPRPDVDVGRLRLLLSLERATDTIVWQLLASVFVPGFTIHTVVQAAHAALLPLEAARPVRDAAAALAGSVAGMASADALLLVADKSIPTVVGLAAIPFIVHPIDNAIHALLNVTLRPALKRLVCEQGKGREAGLELCEECGPWKRPGNKGGGGGGSKH